MFFSQKIEKSDFSRFCAYDVRLNFLTILIFFHIKRPSLANIMEQQTSTLAVFVKRFNPNLKRDGQFERIKYQNDQKIKAQVIGIRVGQYKFFDFFGRKTKYLHISKFDVFPL